MAGNQNSGPPRADKGLHGPLRNTTVMLDDESRAKLNVIGRGSVSSGVRILVHKYAEQELRREKAAAKTLKGKK